MTANNQRPLGRPRASDRKQPTTDIILQAAIELFLARGYQEVSVDDVATAANVTKATVYYYYPSKAALFTETIVQLMSHIHAQIQAILQKAIPLRERLLEIAEAHLTATFDIDLDSFMRETKNAVSEEQTIRMQHAEEKLYKAIEQAIIEEASANGEKSSIDSTFAAHAYVALLRVGNYRDRKGNGIFPTTTETAEQIVDFFWNGLRLP
ncbi:TetR/AcrR family transcriptional regulator [Sediminibacillus halophilus]|uniref:DNA-binding transcriptional regulator, AcrR family n=1 Tax=Sediminibacillus halophilus TaxID=482461 RepID=A0A1G9PAF0_9BACI|nr:TetR/AcrR family transcriptional regulator [Sediminibacillus halophilus]SDL95543.1 DNA-binding transcriptional regulator, AcrR family [Sediminibacillus halophilus]